jgi:hypothetical protein
MMSNRGLFAIAATVSLLAVLSYVRVSTTPVKAIQDDTIAAPEDWVAFDADFRKSKPDGSIDISGRFYRASDGSTREDWFAKSQLKMIQIQNVPLSKYYLWRSDTPNMWEDHDMKLPPFGHHPLKRHMSMEGLSGVAAPIAGHQVFRYLDKSNTMELQSPALNFFPLVLEDLTTGTRQEYTNIVKREPATELFVPPPGAVLEHRFEPMGIVYLQKQQHH